MKTQLRKAVRDHISGLIRRPIRSDASAKGVLTVTGILASPLPWAAAEAGAWGGVEDMQGQVDEVINHLFAHTRYLLTLKGRPPFNLAGLETYQRLHKVVEVRFKLLTHRLDLRLVTLYQGLQAALAPFAPRAHEIDHGAVWRRDIADILGFPGDPAFSSIQLAGS